MTKIVTTDRNRIHHLPREINNTIMGRTITDRNTTGAITNTNWLWRHTSKVSNCGTWRLWFTTSKGSRLGLYVQIVHIQHVQSTSHHHNRNQILYLMNTIPHLQFGCSFSGRPIQVLETHRYIMQMQKKQVNNIIMVKALRLTKFSSSSNTLSR